MRLGRVCWVVAAAVLWGGVPLAQPPAPRQQLIDYLNGLAGAQLAERARAVAAITTRAAAKRRRAEVRARIRTLVGGIPDRAASLAVRRSAQWPPMASASRRSPTKACLISGSPRMSTCRRAAPDRFRRSCSRPAMAPAARARTGAGAAISRGTGLSCLPTIRSARVSGCSIRRRCRTWIIGNPTGEHGEANIGPLLIGDTLARYIVNTQCAASTT